MKLTEYIKGLEFALKQHGDLDVIYAKDEEGNGFYPVSFEPSVGRYEDGEFQQEEIESEEFNAVCVN